ncbi:MAG: DUF4446 family protein [Patescibacteria group bacterium]|nr:DUF4446 family protein [Patescibacteria group bacterium]MDE2116425.1 DUF4446 family protein [Patescibacteria group bacterium]
MILDSNILVGVLALTILALTIDVFCLRRKIRTMMKNENCKDGVCTDIGETLSATAASIKDLTEFRADMEDYLKTVEKRLRRANQATETIRFNAFGGGGQSFATAFVNEEGDGAILSSLYARDRVSVFAKPLARFDSEFELTDEERRAISLAKTKLK